MKITIEAFKPLFAKKNRYRASFGSFSEEAATKEEAKQKMESALEWYFSEDVETVTYKSIPSAKIMLVMERGFNGYIINCFDYHSDRPRGSSVYGRITHKKAFEYLENHAEGYAIQSA